MTGQEDRAEPSISTLQTHRSVCFPVLPAWVQSGSRVFLIISDRRLPPRGSGWCPSPAAGVSVGWMFRDANVFRWQRHESDQGWSLFLVSCLIRSDCCFRVSVCSCYHVLVSFWLIRFQQESEKDAEKLRVALHKIWHPSALRLQSAEVGLVFIWVKTAD